MKRTNTQTIKEALNLFLDENPELVNKLAETRLKNAWNTVMGNLTQKYTSSIYIKNKVLYVQLSSSVLRSELMMCREQLVRRLNQEAGRDVIIDIVLT